MMNSIHGFFQGIVHVSRDASVENIRGWRNFGNFFPRDFATKKITSKTMRQRDQSVNFIYIIYGGSPGIVILLFIEADYGH